MKKAWLTVALCLLIICGVGTYYLLMYQNSNALSNTSSNSYNNKYYVFDGSSITEGSNVSVNSSLRILSGKNVSMKVNNKTYTIHLYENATANDFYSKLPLTLTATNYGEWEEKVVRLKEPLSMANAPAGDNPHIPEVGYYEAENWIAIYYGFIGYWSGKVPLGSID